VDQYTDVVLEFGGGFGNVETPEDAITGLEGTTNAWTVGVAALTTDLGSALGLPVGLTATGGWTSIYSNKYEATGHATERVNVRSNIAGQMFKFAVEAGPATINLGIGFELGAAAAPAQDYAVYVDVPGIADMVDIELGYFIADDDDFKGNLMFSASADGIADMIDAAAGFRYNTLADGGVGAEQWFWGVGVKANVSMFGIGLGVSGQEEAEFRLLTVDVNVGITDEFGADIGLGLGFGDVLETFGGFEGSVYYEAGAATWRLGYLYQASDINGYAYTAPLAAPVDGSGLFLACGLDF
jgi:hypothetical protein